METGSGRPPAGIHTDTDDLPALSFQPSHGPCRRRVLYRGRHHTAAGGARSRAANGQIVRFGATRREYDLVSVTTNQSGHVPPSALDRILCPPTGDVPPPWLTAGLSR